MWCVADLDEDYIADMEDTLETYERPYDPQPPVVCLDEKPVTLHAEVSGFSPTESMAHLAAASPSLLGVGGEQTKPTAVGESAKPFLRCGTSVEDV